MNHRRFSKLVGFVTVLICLPPPAHRQFCYAQHKPEPITIVAFGDSTTAPREVNGRAICVYADILRKELLPKGIDARVLNAGVGGNNTAQAKERFQRDVLAHAPNLVIIQFGANDSAIDVWKKPPATRPRVAIGQYEDNLRTFVETLRKRGARVILMTPNPFRWTAQMKIMYGKPPYNPDDPDGFNLLLKDYAEAVRKIAAQTKVPLVDVYAAFAKHGQSVDELLLDGVHPNDQGHRLVGDLLVDEILSLAEKQLLGDHAIRK